LRREEHHHPPGMRILKLTVLCSSTPETDDGELQAEIESQTRGTTVGKTTDFISIPFLDLHSRSEEFER